MDTSEPAPPRPDHPLRPLDPPMMPFMITGTAAWAVAGGVLLSIGAPAEWLWICLAGLLLGLPLVAVMAAHDRRRRARPQAPPAGANGSTSVSS